MSSSQRFLPSAVPFLSAQRREPGKGPALGSFKGTTRGMCPCRPWRVPDFLKVAWGHSWPAGASSETSMEVYSSSMKLMLVEKSTVGHVDIAKPDSRHLWNAMPCVAVSGPAWQCPSPTASPTPCSPVLTCSNGVDCKLGFCTPQKHSAWALATLWKGGPHI